MFWLEFISMFIGNVHTLSLLRTITPLCLRGATQEEIVFTKIGGKVADSITIEIGHFGLFLWSVSIHYHYINLGFNILKVVISFDKFCSACGTVIVKGFNYRASSSISSGRLFSTGPQFIYCRWVDLHLLRKKEKWTFKKYALSFQIFL